METVADIDTAAREVRLERGDALRYDHLLLASGATHAYFGHDEWAAHAPGLTTLDDALHIRPRILSAFERSEARPVGKACVRKCRSRWSPDTSKQQDQKKVRHNQIRK